MEEAFMALEDPMQIQLVGDAIGILELIQGKART